MITRPTTKSTVTGYYLVALLLCKHLESQVKRLGPIAFNPAATPDDDDDLHRLATLMKWWAQWTLSKVP